MTRPTVPFQIRSETENYLVRTLSPSEASERACAWLADPLKARMLNMRPRTLSLDEFSDYIASHDGIAGHILGIFEKESGAHVGLWSVYIDWDLKEFLVNVLVGGRGPDMPAVRQETQPPLIRYLFDGLGLETVRCAVLSDNHSITDQLANAGIEPEHKSFKASATEQAFVEIQHFSVSKEVWRDLRARADRREQIVAVLNAARAGI
jgi:hypothetical protein